MSRVVLWMLIAVIGMLMYVGGAASANTVNAAIWFGGLALLLHWIFEDMA